MRTGAPGRDAVRAKRRPRPYTEFVTEDPRQSNDLPDRDERVALPLDPEVALRALLAVDPDDDADENESPKPDAR